MFSLNKFIKDKSIEVAKINLKGNRHYSKTDTIKTSTRYGMLMFLFKIDYLKAVIS